MINISELPIAFYCKACKTNFRRESLSSYPCKCPECGQERTSSGFYRLPTLKFYKSPPGSYNLLNSADKKCQFTFYSLEGFSISILTEPENFENFEFDFDDYLGQILRMIEDFDFYYMGDKEKIQKFYDEVVSPNAEQHQINYLKNKKEELLIEMWKLNSQRNSYISDLESLEPTE